MLIIVLITDLCSETHSMFQCHHLCPHVALKKHSCSLFSWLSCHYPLWPLPFNLLVSNWPYTNIFGLGPGPFPFLPHSLHLFSPLLIPSTGPQPLKHSSNPGRFPEPWASRPTADLTAPQDFAWALQKPEMSRNFPGALVVKTSPSNAETVSWISGRGTKIPHSLWPKNIKQKQIVTDSIKTFKMVYFKKNSFKKTAKMPKWELWVCPPQQLLTPGLLHQPSYLLKPETWE